VLYPINKNTKIHDNNMMNLFEEIIYALIGKQIRQYREKKDLTQEKLASDIGVSRASIANYESGKQAIYISDLYKIANSLEVEVADLLPKTTEIAKKSSLEALLQNDNNLKEEEKRAVRDFMKKVEQREGRT